MCILSLSYYEPFVFHQVWILKSPNISFGLWLCRGCNKEYASVKLLQINICLSLRVVLGGQH